MHEELPMVMVVTVSAAKQEGFYWLSCEVTAALGVRMPGGGRSTEQGL